MDAAAEIERNPVSKHQIQPEYGEAGLRGTGRSNPSKKLGRERGQGKVHFSCPADHKRIGNHTRFIHDMVEVMTTHEILYISMS